jgi:hypothetical protein
MAVNQKPVSFSYGELTFGSISDEEIARLERGDGVDAQTQARIAHLGRFFSHIGSLGSVSPKGTCLEDFLTPEELQAIWRETAESGVDVGLCPLLH